MRDLEGFCVRRVFLQKVFKGHTKVFKHDKIAKWLGSKNTYNAVLRVTQRTEASGA